MNEMEALHELFKTKFEALNQRFDGQDRILERIEEQTTKTNGRVNTLEKVVAGVTERVTAILDRLVGHDREIRDLKRSGHASAAAPPTSEQTTGENRRITQRDVWLVIGSVGIALAIMQAIGMIKAVAR